ncbi:MAG TPA: PAS domain S-box protein [Oculatellaceae cyanobacterium]
MSFDCQLFLNDFPEAFCVLDGEWRYVFVNRKFVAMVGKTADQLLGNKIWDVFEDAEHSAFLLELQRISEHGTAGEFVSLSALLGRWLSVHAYPFEGNLAMIISEAHDTQTAAVNTRESYLRLLLNSTGEGIYAVNNSGRCTFVNKAATEMFGFKPEELLGKKMHLLVHHTRANGAPYPASECHVYRAFSHEEAVEIDDEIFWRQNGTSFAVEYTSYPVRLNGIVHGAVVAFNDITQRKLTEAALKESEERFRSFVTNTAQIVWTTGPSGTFDTEQVEWSRFTGQSVGQSLHWGWLEAVHAEDRDLTKSTWLQAVAAKSSYQHEHRVRRYDSLFRYMIVKATPVSNADGTVREWIGIHTDITDRKTAELERERLLVSERKARKEAEESKHRALSLAGELAVERDKLNLSNNKLQGLVDQLETAGKSLYEKQERQALITRFLRGANRVAAQITSSDALGKKFDNLMITLRNEFRMSHAGIWICEPSGHLLLRAAEVGLADAPSRALESQIDVNMHSYKLGWVARLKRPYVSHDISNDIQMDQEWIAENKIVSAAFFPLLEKDRLLGVIAAFSRYELPIEGADIIGTMAAVLAATMKPEQE